MQNKLILPLVAASTLIWSAGAALGQSAYYQAVTNLNPAAYWPLQETVQPPIGDVEVNLGSLGPVANAVYSSTWATKGFAGAIVSESDTAVNFISTQDGGFLSVPTTDPRVAVPVGPFTVEAWVYPANYNGFVGIVSQAGANPGSLNGASATADANGLLPQGGWCLSANYIAYLDSGNLRGFSFHVYNGHSYNGNGAPRQGAEIAVPYNYQLNQWYHIVASFDGTNNTMYINGVNMNSVAFRIPMPAGTSYLPDSWDPLCIGCSRGLHNNRYGGGIDEVAIYTNVLTAVQVQNHYQAATNPAPATPYEQIVTGDNAYMYWRMDSSGYSAPDPSTYPNASYYSANSTVMSVASGTLASSNAIYGTATQPGVAGPSFPGLLDPSNGNNSYGVAINGIGGNNGANANVNIGNGVYVAEAIPVDIGYNAALDPVHPPLSISVWFRGNPSEANGSTRFETIAGHSDSSWRIAMSQTGHVQFNAGSGSDVVSSFVYNDGKWHHAVGVCNGSGTNAGTNLLYIDGRLDFSAAFATLTFNHSPQDAMIGGDPQYLNGGNGTYPSVPASTATYAQRNFGGSVAHFAFFTNALTAANVAALYQSAGAPPVILGQPFGPRTNGWAYNGTNTYLFFGVTASGSAPLSYQWYLTNASGLTMLTDGAKYSNSQTFQVTVSNLVDSDSGTYFVVVSNPYGSVTSSIGTTAGLFQGYLEPKVLSQSPAGGTYNVYAGQTAPAFTATVTAATNNLVYQWFTNGVAVAGATTTSLPVPAATLANSGEVVQLFITNAFGVASSSAVTVNVLPDPTPPTNAYAQTVMSYNPTGYWPMHEVEPVTAQQDIETNYGTLGSLANAYYCDWQIIGQGPPLQGIVVHQQQSALGNDPNPSAFFSGQAAATAAYGASCAIIPRTSPLTTIKAPFTLEAWVKPEAGSSFGIIFGVGSITAGSGLNGGANEGGFDWLYGGSANCFSITMRNGSGTASTEPKTQPNYPPGQWYHLVTTFDGTNIAYYINGVQDFLQNSSAATLNPNTWMPLTIAGGRWNNTVNNLFQGGIDELAVYTNVLSVPDIQTHYNDGATGANGAYKTDVLNDHPILYYRMDSPIWSNQPTSSFAALTNYGSSGVQGFYKFNAVPGGVAGPGAVGFPNTALAGDGMSIFADAGYDTTFNPLGQTKMSVTAWFRANPADVQQRNWQTFAGHSDQNWRCAMNGGTGAVGFDSGNGLDVRSTNLYNDGLWHQIVGTYDGSNTLVYVDGVIQGQGFKNSGQSTAQGQPSYDVYLASSPNGQSNTFSGGRSFAGQVCEIAFFNGTNLSAVQVSNLYSSSEIPPYITKQPVSTNADQNGTFTNTVVAGGSPTLSYQWYNGATALPGQTGSAFVLNPVLSTSGSTNYYVVVSNNYGSITSASFALTINTNPVITQDLPFTSLVLLPGDHPTLTIQATGAHPLYFQWYSNNAAAPGAVSITGATNNSFMLSSNVPPGTTNMYYCTVSNFLGATNSMTVTVVVEGEGTPPNFDHYADIITADNPVGFWRLDECPDAYPNNGTTANDYWNGNDGYYNQVNLCQTPGYNSTIDANEATALFGQSASSDSDVALPAYIDFATTGNANFSVEAWINAQTESTGGPVVSKGYGGGGEEFCLDFGGGAAHALRWFIRYANGTAPNVTATWSPSGATYGTWHHVVGVVNESSNYMALYLDGTNVGVTAIPSGSGIEAGNANQSISMPVYIGARSSGISVNHNDIQYLGEISQVAIYNYALSAIQASNHFVAAGVAPIFILQPPAATNVDQNATLVIPSLAIGTPPFAYQWIDQNQVPLAGQTNPVLTLASVPASTNGSSFQVIVTNQYGGITSSPVTITVNQGAPVIVQNLPALLLTADGVTNILQVTAIGTEPFTYTWYSNGVVIPGVTTSSYTNITVFGSNQYYVTIGNSFTPPVTTSQTETIVGAAGTPPVTFPATGSSGWTLNAQANGAPTFTNGVLELTDGGGSESRQAWYNTKVDVSKFLVQFTYVDTTGGTAGADGITFCIQSTGTGATGGGGGALGVSGISPSVDFAMNIYHGTTPPGPAAGWNLNGGNATTATAPLVLDAGSHPINCTIYYDGTTAKAWLNDPTAGTASPLYSLAVNIPTFVSNPAYIGFTGATGGSAAYQEVYNFSYATVTFPTLAAQRNGTSVTVSWPSTTTSLYQLQSAPSLLGPWSNIASGITASGGQNTYTGSPNAATFYRLILPIH
jgi:hypothetical protein